MKLLTVEEEWRTFESLVVSPNASDIQRSEMQKAFFAGASAMMCNFMKLGSDEFPEGTCDAWIDARRLELDAFVKQMLRELANLN